MPNLSCEDSLINDSLILARNFSWEMGGKLYLAFPTSYLFTYSTTTIVRQTFPLISFNSTTEKASSLDWYCG